MWGDLMKFFTGNPSMNLVQDAWNGRQTASASTPQGTGDRGVNVHWDITNRIRLVRNVTKRDNRTLVTERGKPVAAATRKDFKVTGEDAHNVTARLSVDTQIATNSETKLTRWQVVNLEYENVQAFFDWSTKGEGGYLSRTAFRDKNYSSAQEAADAVYNRLAPSLEKMRFQTKILHDGPFGTHVPSD
jgi:hypothetical protein